MKELFCRLFGHNMDIHSTYTNKPYYWTIRFKCLRCKKRLGSYTESMA